MLEKLKFYVQHSLNDLRVNGQRTLFALLCIAAGVAAGQAAHARTSLGSNKQRKMALLS